MDCHYMPLAKKNTDNQIDPANFEYLVEILYENNRGRLMRERERPIPFL